MTEAINLDALDADELRELARTHPHDRLRLYAMLKADAMDDRSRGRIALAMLEEAQCDRIYSALPESLRW